MKKTKKSVIVTTVVSFVASLNLISMCSANIANADSIGIQGVTTQSSILSVEDATLQNYLW